jgi:hypothetical protein
MKQRYLAVIAVVVGVCIAATIVPAGAQALTGDQVIRAKEAVLARIDKIFNDALEARDNGRCKEFAELRRSLNYFTGGAVAQVVHATTGGALTQEQADPLLEYARGRANQLYRLDCKTPADDLATRAAMGRVEQVVDDETGEVYLCLFDADGRKLFSLTQEEIYRGMFDYSRCWAPLDQNRAAGSLESNTGFLTHMKGMLSSITVEVNRRREEKGTSDTETGAGILQRFTDPDRVRKYAQSMGIDPAKLSDADVKEVTTFAERRIAGLKSSADAAGAAKSKTGAVHGTNVSRPKGNFATAAQKGGALKGDGAQKGEGAQLLKGEQRPVPGGLLESERQAIAWQQQVIDGFSQKFADAGNLARKAAAQNFLQGYEDARNAIKDALENLKGAAMMDGRIRGIIAEEGNRQLADLDKEFGQKQWPSVLGTAPKDLVGDTPPPRQESVLKDAPEDLVRIPKAGAAGAEKTMTMPEINEAVKNLTIKEDIARLTQELMNYSFRMPDLTNRPQDQRKSVLQDAPDDLVRDGATKAGNEVKSQTKSKTAKTVKQPTASQAKSKGSQGNDAASQIGQQLMQGLIQGGIQYGIGRAMGGGGNSGGGNSHQSNAPSVKKSNVQTAKPQGAAAKPSGGSTPSGGVMFYGVTGPGR